MWVWWCDFLCHMLDILEFSVLSCICRIQCTSSGDVIHHYDVFIVFSQVTFSPIDLLTLIYFLCPAWRFMMIGESYLCVYVCFLQCSLQCNVQQGPRALHSDWWARCREEILGGKFKIPTSVGTHTYTHWVFLSLYNWSHCLQSGLDWYIKTVQYCYSDCDSLQSGTMDVMQSDCSHAYHKLN